MKSTAHKKFETVSECVGVLVAHGHHVPAR
jgi:hypothetical protein